MKVTIKRHFAVILEDAIQVTVPDDLGDAADVREWAIDNYDELYAAAVARGTTAESMADSAPQLLWENEHHADIDAWDDAYEVEAEP